MLALCRLCYAKSLQSCPTLCNPIDGSPPGSPVPGILQARTLEWVAISFSIMQVRGEDILLLCLTSVHIATELQRLFWSKNIIEQCLICYHLQLSNKKACQLLKEAPSLKYPTAYLFHTTRKLTKQSTSHWCLWYHCYRYDFTY